MVSPFIHGKKSVLQQWKDLRSRLTSDLSDQEQLNMVMGFWNKAPISKIFMDWDHPGSWPSPWEMISADEYDDSMISLAMFYSLLLGQDQRWENGRLSLVLVRDQELCVQRLVLEIDGEWFMNLEYDRLVSKTSRIGRSCVVQQRYSYDGRSHQTEDDKSFSSMVKTSDNRCHG